MRLETMVEAIVTAVFSAITVRKSANGKCLNSIYPPTMTIWTKNCISMKTTK